MKKICITITIITTAITSYHCTNAMFLTRTTRVAGRQGASRSTAAVQQKAQRHFLQTRPAATTTQPQTPQEKITLPVTPQPQQMPIQTAGVYSYWVALKNKIFGTPSAATTVETVKTIKTPQPAVKTPQAPEGVATKIAENELIIKQIDATKNLPEAETILKNVTNAELNHIKTEAEISDNQWTDLLERTRTAVNYIQQNCFTAAHPNASHDTDIPAELYDKIFNALKQENINPASMSIHYRDTIDIDPFDHETISVTGPTITYKTDAYNTSITGYEPAAITLHRQNISKLTESQFDAHMLHTITHLKQAHKEQLKLLQEAIGDEKYEQYAEPYKQALENEADLLEPIKSAAAAKTVQRAFLDQALNFSLAEIKESRKKHGLENTETGLMVCAIPRAKLSQVAFNVLNSDIKGAARHIADYKDYQEIYTAPGAGPKWLLDIASFEDVEKYLNDEKEKIYTEMATNDGIIDYEKLNNYKKTVQDETGYINSTIYKTPLKNLIHDNNNLSPWILETTKRLLKEAGINPDSVHIISEKLNFAEHQKTEPYLLKMSGVKGHYTRISRFASYLLSYRISGNPASASSPTVSYQDKNNSWLATDPIITLNQKTLSQQTHEEILYTIGHEIGHLVQNHITSLVNLELLYSKDKKNIKKDLEEKLNHIYEIEADITYAKHNPEIAQYTYKNYLQKFAARSPYFGKSKPNQPYSKQTSPYTSHHTHPSFMNRFYWIRRIVELHQKEAAQKQKTLPLFAPEKE